MVNQPTSGKSVWLVGAFAAECDKAHKCPHCQLPVLKKTLNVVFRVGYTEGVCYPIVGCWAPCFLDRCTCFFRCIDGATIALPSHQETRGTDKL